MKYNLNIIQDYLDKGLIQVQQHPTLPLKIYNYSRECQFESKWDDLTKACRGLILDNEGNIVARPFPKFFNMEELDSSQIPNEPFEVFEKMDGSLGIVFNYNDEWHISTRGSFTSEQAIKGKELLKKYKYEYLPTDTTYLFEILYPENRIVCNYGKEEKLVLLASIHTKTGEEYNIHNEKYEDLDFEIVKRYNGLNDYKQLKPIIKDDQEGFVIRFKSGFRMKIKGEEYCRLHKLVSNLNEKYIWECLSTNTPIDLTNLPDEQDKWLKNTIQNFKILYNEIEELCKYAFNDYMDKSILKEKKTYAMWVQTKKLQFQPILYRMFDGKDYSNIIWKLLKP